MEEKVLNNHGVLERPALTVQRLKDFFRRGVMSSGSSACLLAVQPLDRCRTDDIGHSRARAGADIMGLKTVSTQPLPEVILMSCDVFCTVVVHHRLGFLNLYMRPDVCGSVIGGCNQDVFQVSDSVVWHTSDSSVITF